jgi:hypothetical protein
MVDRLVYVGSVTHVIVRLATGRSLQVLAPNDGAALGYTQGTPVQAHVPPEALRILEPATGGLEANPAAPVSLPDIDPASQDSRTSLGAIKGAIGG